MMEPEDTLLIPSILASSQRLEDEHSDWPGYHADDDIMSYRFDADDIMSYRFDAGQSCAAVQEQLRRRGMATTEMQQEISSRSVSFPSPCIADNTLIRMKWTDEREKRMPLITQIRQNNLMLDLNTFGGSDAESNLRLFLNYHKSLKEHTEHTEAHRREPCDEIYEVDEPGCFQRHHLEIASTSRFLAVDLLRRGCITLY
jgi:hypothetical protein